MIIFSTLTLFLLQICTKIDAFHPLGAISHFSYQVGDCNIISMFAYYKIFFPLYELPNFKFGDSQLLHFSLSQPSAIKGRKQEEARDGREREEDEGGEREGSQGKTGEETQ